MPATTVQSAVWDMQALAQWSAGFFTLASVVLSLKLINDHLHNYTQPAKQRLVIVIMLMVPLFAVDSFVGLLEIEAAEWVVMILDSVKEIYESVVIASFLKLMFLYVNVDPNSDAEVPEEIKGRPIHHSFPFTLLLPHEEHMNNKLVKKLYLWTLQFVYLRPPLSILAVVLDYYGLYDNYSIWFTIVLNISVTLAVYALMLFYHAFAAELQPWRPLAQFLCIKGVVFFAFWQGIILTGLAYCNVLHKGLWYDVAEIETAVQNFLVCVEMGLIFSPAHLYAFTASLYEKKRDAKKNE